MEPKKTEVKKPDALSERLRVAHQQAEKILGVLLENREFTAACGWAQMKVELGRCVAAAIEQEKQMKEIDERKTARVGG